MSEGRKFLTGVFAFLFILSGFIALFAFNIEQKAFSSETYKQAFKQQGLYEDAAGIFARVVMDSGGDSGNLLSLLTVFNRDDLESVISILVPPQDLEFLTDDLLDSAFAFLDGDTDSVTVSLGSIKQNLAGSAGVDAVLQFFLAQPECSMAQLLQMGMGLFSSDGGMILCKPPNEMLGLITPLIQSQLQLVAQGLPDELTVFRTGQNEGSRDFRQNLDRLRLIMKLTVIPPIVFLLAITILAVRSLRDWLKWWGFPFLITGILGLLTALLAAPLVPLIVEFLFSQSGPDIPAIFLELVRNTAGSLAGEILRPVAILGIAIASIGVVMVTMNWILKRQN